MRTGSFLRTDLTAEYVREQLSYDPGAGIFMWRTKRRGRYPGVPIGCRRKGDGYLVIQIDGHLYVASRLAWLYMTGEWPPAQVDHWDKNSSNNAWDNLRAATPSQNGANIGAQRNNKCGLKGVCAYRGRWIAQLSVNRQRVLRAAFDTPEEAHAAYVAAARKHFGDFARAA
jgi:hypothetical protein